MTDDPDPGPRKPSRDVMVLTELEQIKVLADSLRIRILEEFAEERTTKQVADRLGEKPTKLYHHVDALEKVGLIERTRTKRNRGTLEKYYVATACSFRAELRASSAHEAGREGGEGQDALRSVVSSILDTATAELQSLIDAEDAVQTLEKEGILSFLEVHATAEEARELRDRLMALIEELTTPPAADADAPGGRERSRLLITLYPLPDSPPAKTVSGPGGPQARAAPGRKRRRSR